METYKKPIVTSQNDNIYSIVAVEPPVMITGRLKKLLGGDDFHAEKSLTPRKKSID